MDAARRCFVRRGINISVDEICAEAGVSKGALYGYFASKEEVIQAIADEHVADLGRLKAAADKRELVAALLERLSNGDRSANRLELEAWAYAMGNKPLLARLAANSSELCSAINEAVSRIGVSETFSDIKDLSLMLETLALGLVAKAALGRGDEVRKTLEVTVEKVLGG